MPRVKSWSEGRPIPTCELGVLHAFGPGYLQASNRLLEFRGSGDRRLRVPLRGLQLVCLYGPVRVTASAIRLITEAGGALAYLSANGLRTNGMLQPASDPWKGRRYRQFRACQDRAWMLGQARLLVTEKLNGMAAAAESYLRHARQASALQHIVREVPLWRERVAGAAEHDSLRGLEGTASRCWFQALDQLLPEGWTLPGRRKRPPTDPVNALLSLGYTLLFQRLEAACQAWGLDSALGVYHEYRPGRASLACDLVEPFRVAAVDRTLLACLGRGQFRPEDFVQDPGNMSVRLTEGAWKRWLEALETQMHVAGSGGVTLHGQIVQRVGRFAESLPAWDGRWPGPPAPPEQV